jgi:hypothetical protein
VAGGTATALLIVEKSLGDKRASYMRLKCAEKVCGIANVHGRSRRDSSQSIRLAREINRKFARARYSEMAMCGFFVSSRALYTFSLCCTQIICS